MQASRFPIGPFDFHWFSVINGLATKSSVLDGLGKILALYGPEIWAGIFLLLWFWPPQRANRARRAVVYATVAGIVALAINVALSHGLPFRPRPFVYLPASMVHQLIPHANDSSFPSDHAAGSFAFAIGLFYAGSRSGWWALLLAAAIAVARVFVGVHWPTDVLAGAAVGLLSGVVVLGLRGMVEPLVQWLFKLFRFRPAPAGQRY